eukprot:362360-Chlamydomonas_euryale.AAC.4
MRVYRGGWWWLPAAVVVMTGILDLVQETHVQTHKTVPPTPPFIHTIPILAQASPNDALIRLGLGRGPGFPRPHQAHRPQRVAVQLYSHKF